MNHRFGIEKRTENNLREKIEANEMRVQLLEVYAMLI